MPKTTGVPRMARFWRANAMVLVAIPFAVGCTNTSWQGTQMYAQLTGAYSVASPPRYRLDATTPIRVAIAAASEPSGDLERVVAQSATRAARASFLNVDQATDPENLAQALASARRDGAQILVWPEGPARSRVQSWTAAGIPGPVLPGRLPGGSLRIWLLDCRTEQVIHHADIALRIDGPAGWRAEPRDLERALRGTFASLVAGG